MKNENDMQLYAGGAIELPEIDYPQSPRFIDIDREKFANELSSFNLFLSPYIFSGLPDLASFSRKDLDEILLPLSQERDPIKQKIIATRCWQNKNFMEYIYGAILGNSHGVDLKKYESAFRLLRKYSMTMTMESTLNDQELHAAAIEEFINRYESCRPLSFHHDAATLSLELLIMKKDLLIERRQMTIPIQQEEEQLKHVYRNHAMEDLREALIRFLQEGERNPKWKHSLEYFELELQPFIEKRNENNELPSSELVQKILRNLPTNALEEIEDVTERCWRKDEAIFQDENKDPLQLIQKSEAPYQMGQINWLRFFTGVQQYSTINRISLKTEVIRGMILFLYREIHDTYPLIPLLQSQKYDAIWNDLSSILRKTSDNNSEVKKIFSILWPRGKKNTQRHVPKGVNALFRMWDRMEREESVRVPITYTKQEIPPISLPTETSQKISTTVEKTILVSKFFTALGNNKIVTIPVFGAAQLIAKIGEQEFSFPLGEKEQIIDFTDIIKEINGMARNVTVRFFLQNADGETISIIQSRKFQKTVLVEKDTSSKPDLLPPAEKNSAELPKKENLPFQNFQEELLAAIELGSMDDIQFFSESRSIIFSDTLLELLGENNVPFEIYFTEDPFSVSSNIELLPELKRVLEKRGREFFAEKKRQEALLLQQEEIKKQKEVALQEEQERIQRINEMKDWYNDVMLSPEWGAIRKKDIKFRHRIETFQKEEKNPYAMIVRLKSDHGQAMVSNFNTSFPEGIRLHMDKSLEGGLSTPFGEVRISFSSQNDPQISLKKEADSSEVAELLLGMAKCSLNAFLISFDKDVTSYRDLVEKAEKQRSRTHQPKLKESAQKKLDEGRAAVVLAHDENGFVSRIKYNVGWEEAEALGGEILLKHSLVKFPLDEKGEGVPEFDSSKYESFHELLEVSSNKKYFIRRLQTTACDALGIPKNGNTAEPLHDPKAIAIMKEVVEATDFSLEELARLKHASTLLDKPCGTHENWIDVFVHDLEKEQYPLLSVQHAITCDLDELKEERKKNHSNSTLSPTSPLNSPAFTSSTQRAGDSI